MNLIYCLLYCSEHPWIQFNHLHWILNHKLLHSPNLVVLGMPVGFEIWPPIGWHHPFVIGWSKYRLGLLHSQCIVGLSNWWEFSPFCKGHWQSPCSKILPLGLCKVTVKVSNQIMTLLGGQGAKGLMVSSLHKIKVSKFVWYGWVECVSYDLVEIAVVNGLKGQFIRPFSAKHRIFWANSDNIMLVIVPKPFLYKESVLSVQKIPLWI